MVAPNRVLLPRVTVLTRMIGSIRDRPLTRRMSCSPQPLRRWIRCCSCHGLERTLRQQMAHGIDKYRDELIRGRQRTPKSDEQSGESQWCWLFA